MGGEVWRTGVERRTEAEQQGEKDRGRLRERKTERRCNARRMWGMWREPIHECVE